MKIRCLIVDDEPLARKGLREYCEQIEFLDLVLECKNAMQANDALKTCAVDLLFLDIEMPLLTGLDFLRSLPNSPHVIFTTAYSNYALQGYEFNVIDYLVKPISFERFLQAANKAFRVFEQMSAEPPADASPFIFVKSDKLLKKIFIRDIQFIEAMQNYVVFHTVHDSITVHTTIKQVYGTLPQGEFLQVHKSYIVSRSNVEAIDGNQIIIGKHRIPISTRLKRDVLDALINNRHKG